MKESKKLSTDLMELPEIDLILEIEKVKKEADQLMMKKLEEINDLKNKIDEGRTAIVNMQAQLNGLVGAVQLCDDFLNNPEEPKKGQ